MGISAEEIESVLRCSFRDGHFLVHGERKDEETIGSPNARATETTAVKVFGNSKRRTRSETDDPVRACICAKWAGRNCCPREGEIAHRKPDRMPVHHDDQRPVRKRAEPSKP